MELTEGMLRGFKAAAQDGLNRDISTRATSITLLLLIEEIERLRAEVEALRNTKDPLFVLGFGTSDAAPVEPAPAREIAVGDRVRIVAGNRKGEIGVVTDAYWTVLSEFTVSVVDASGNETRLRFRRNEIEPA